MDKEYIKIELKKLTGQWGEKEGQQVYRSPEIKEKVEELKGCIAIALEEESTLYTIALLKPIGELINLRGEGNAPDILELKKLRVFIESI